MSNFIWKVCRGKKDGKAIYQNSHLLLKPKSTKSYFIEENLDAEKRNILHFSVLWSVAAGLEKLTFTN